MSAPDTPQMYKKMKDLDSRVSEFVPTRSFFAFDNPTEFLSSPKLYLYIPILILILLLFFKPDFIKMYKTGKDGLVRHKVSFKKLFIYWLSIIVLLYLGIFGYNYKVNHS